jgi:diguanylate cyclase (GGDEF)-like protein
MSDHWSMPVSSAPARRVVPFLAAAAFGLVLGTVSIPEAGVGELAASIGLTLAVVASAALPWTRLPVWAQVVPPLVYLLAVALLRDAVGGASSGVGILVLLSALWVALYGTRAQLLAVLAALAVVFYAPMILIGAPEYPAAGWRSGALIVVVATVVGTTIQGLISRLRAVLAERAALLDRLERLAARDPLTGLANRRTWDERLDRALADAGRHDRPLAVAVLDLDHFKAVNDAHGHGHGDRVLHDAAGAWEAELRPADVLARIGGEEFAVLLPECSLDDAVAAVERVRAATPHAQTCSAGVAAWDGGETAAALVDRADRLLYDAKRRGRDRTVAEPARPPAALRVA